MYGVGEVTAQTLYDCCKFLSGGAGDVFSGLLGCWPLLAVGEIHISPQLESVSTPGAWGSSWPSGLDRVACLGLERSRSQVRSWGEGEGGGLTCCRETSPGPASHSPAEVSQVLYSTALCYCLVITSVSSAVVHYNTVCCDVLCCSLCFLPVQPPPTFSPEFHPSYTT